MPQSVVLEAFDRDEYASRVARVRYRMEELALDAILVTAPWVRLPSSTMVATSSGGRLSTTK